MTRHYFTLWFFAPTASRRRDDNDVVLDSDIDSGTTIANLYHNSEFKFISARISGKHLFQVDL